MSDEEVLVALRDLASRLGTTELTVEMVEDNLPFGGGTLRKRWGSSRAAFEAAGLTSPKIGYRYTDEECFDNMLAVWTYFGRPPQYREMGELPSKVGGKAYVKRFGTWNKALAAFVERVNCDPDNVPAETAKDQASQDPLPSAQPEYDNGRDRRDIPLGLRFRVLHRDHFKCVLCGNTPAANPSCVLHVDHIVPWSKGGRTAIDNLRSLCAACNMGRGNRYDE